MFNTFDKFVYIGIAIGYNLFTHHITNLFYKDLPFEEKFDKSTTFIFVAGIFGIVLSKLLQNPNKKFTESVLCMGFFIGGLMLIITSMWVNWDNLSDDIRLIVAIGVFGCILWYAYLYDRGITSKSEKSD